MDSRKFVKFITVILIVAMMPLSVIPAYAAFDRAEATEIYNAVKMDTMSSFSYASIEAESGHFVLSSNGDAHINIGSLSKLMTVLITFEEIDKGNIKLDTTFTVTKHAQEVSNGRARAYLDAAKSEKVTVAQCLEAVCISGAYDAACALAEFIGGSEAQFVEIMNYRATQLGLTNSFFTDSTGIDTEQYTSANDLCVIMWNLVCKHSKSLDFLNLTYGKFVHSTGASDTAMVSFNPFNRGGFYTDSDGGMIGSSSDGYSMAATVMKNDQRIVGVCLGSADENVRAAEMRQVLEYSNNNYTYKLLCAEGKYVKKVKVNNGEQTKVACETTTSVYAVVENSKISKIESKFYLDHEPSAPCEAGEYVGYIVYSLDGVELGRADVVTAKSVSKANWFVCFIRWLLSLFGFYN